MKHQKNRSLTHAPTDQFRKNETFEQSKEPTTLTLTIDGLTFTIPYKRDLLSRVTLNYTDNTEKSFWMSCDDIVNNIRMKDKGYVSLPSKEVEYY